MNNITSILMPVYNGERFIELAIKSVLNQTYKNFEFLIYNDGSTDNSLNIIKSFNDDRITIFNSKKNRGIVYGLNYLLKKSNGDIIARIDSDDVWVQNKLEKQINVLNNFGHNCLIACFANLIDDEGKVFDTKFKQYYVEKDIKKYLPNSNFIIHSSVVIPKNIFEKVGIYRDKYLHTEDYDLWLRIMYANIKIIILPEVLLNYRVSRYSVNFRFRKVQSKNVIRLKFNYWRKYGFKFFYISELFLNFYYWFFPYWILRLKRKIFNTNLF